MIQSHDHLLSLAAKIVSAHIGNHTTTPEALPGLIRDIYRTLAAVEPDISVAPRVAAAAAVAPAPRVAAPAHTHAPARTDAAAASAGDHLLTCQECGLTMKMLKRHLITVHGLTPDEYRTKWRLAADAPMVTPEYAKLRSSLAKQSGLGKRPEVSFKTGARRGR
jgi:predicted transcriptional regulator